MSKPTFSELIAKVRLQLQDAEGNYWTDDEITDYLNEGQLEYVRKTKAYRGEAPIVKKENQDTYLLPDDCLEVLRIEDSDGIEIPRTTSDDLTVRRGEFRNRTTTGTAVATDVQFAYSDLDGQGGIRFYPRPNPSTEEVEVSTDLQANALDYPYNLSDFGVVVNTKYDLHIGGLSGSTDKFVIVRLGDYPKSWEYTYNAIDPTGFAWITSNHVMFGSINSYHLHVAGDGDFKIAYHNASQQIEINGVVASITNITSGYSGQEITAWFPVPENADYAICLIYNAGASHSTKLKVAKISGFKTGTYTATIHSQEYTNTANARSIEPKPDGGYWMILSNGDAYELDADGDYVATLSFPAAAGNVFSIGVDYNTNDLVYFGETDRTFYRYDGTTHTATDLTLSASDAGTANTDERNRIVFVDTDKIIWRGKIYNISDGTTEQTTIQDYFDSNGEANHTVFLANCKPHCWNVDANAGDQEDVKELSYAGFGATTTLNTISADCEYGAIMAFDSSDNADLIQFDVEEGAIVSVIQSSIGFHVHYVATPPQDLVVVNEPLALVHYALYKCYEKDGDQTAMQKSSIHESRFEKIMRRDVQRASDGFLGKQTPVKGYHF